MLNTITAKRSLMYKAIIKFFQNEKISLNKLITTTYIGGRPRRQTWQDFSEKRFNNLAALYNELQKNLNDAKEHIELLKDEKIAIKGSFSIKGSIILNSITLSRPEMYQLIMSFFEEENNRLEDLRKQLNQLQYVLTLISNEITEMSKSKIGSLVSWVNEPVKLG